MVATDVEGTVFYFNLAAERMYGYSREQMLGANIMDLLVEPADQLPADDIMASVLAGHRWSGRWRVRRRDGGTTVVWLTDTPILDGGTVVGVIGVSEEIADESSDEPAAAAGTAAKALAVADQMRQAMQSRAVIEQAKGMLIAAHGCSPDEAFEMLSRSSQNSNRKLHEIAEAMVQRAQKVPPAR